jgi:hypothetical protein
MTEERTTFRFGPLERRGLLGPVRAGQALIGVAGALVAVLALDAAPSTGGALIALTAMALAVGLATAPVAGRTVEEWTPVAAAFLIRRVRRRTRLTSTAAQAGMRWIPGRATLVDPDPRPPRGLEDVQLVEIVYGPRRLGALSERAGRRLTAVLACRASSFALLDPEAQERRLARWGTVLSTSAGTAIRRLQWIERSAPAQADELARWLHEARDPGVPPRGTPMVESYLELIGAGTQATHDHEILIAIQVDARRAGDRRTAALGETLVEQAERVARGLEAAEISVLGALSAGQIARSLRTAADPYAGSELAALETVDPRRDGLSTVNAWPLATHESWEHFRCDGALHSTYWIAGWPRVEVSPMFLDHLLGSSAAVRTVGVTFEPVAPARSTREVEAAITRDRADSELRRRFGQGETARQRQAQEAAMRREAELAAGHGEVRLSGFVTVTGRDESELRRAATEVLEQAARARLELHRLYAQQAEAFTFTLPLARGLR